MSLSATRLQEMRVVSDKFDKNMVRPQEYGALDFFIEQTNSPNSIISDDLKNRAFASIGNDIKIPVIEDGSVQVANARTCVIPDNENTSAFYAVTFVTYATGFTMTPTLYLNNEIGERKDWERKIEKVARALANELDKGAIACLEANKTQVFKDLLQYQQSGNVIEIPAQMRGEIFGDLNSIMRANEYPEQLHIIGNAGVDSQIRKMAQHGLYNDVNKQLEFEGKVFHFTNNVTNESGKNGTFYAVADGNVAVLTRVDREALIGGEGNGHVWDVAYLPYINLPVGVHEYTSVGNFSTIAGDASADMTCVRKNYYGYSLDVAYVVAYNSDPENIANPIIKGEMAALNANQPFATPVYITNASEINA